MDNVTHSLFALTLARMSPCRRVRGATVALVIASNAPDIDVISVAGGAVQYLEWHRSFTHGPLGVIGLGPLAAALVHTGLRWSNRVDPCRRSSFRALTGLSMLAVLLHIMMDVPTSYGSRLLSPFDWHWFTADWMPIIDVYLLVALAAGLYFGRGSEAARRRNLVIVLSFMAANYGVRAAAHERARTLAPRLFGRTWPERCAGARPESAVSMWPREMADTPPPPGAVRCVVEVAAIPSLASPFSWRVIAQMSNGYELHDVNLLDPRFWRPAGSREVLWRLSTRYPNQWSPQALRAASTPTGRVFLGFSRFPAAQTFRERDGGITAQFTDLRFVGTGPPGPGRPRGQGRGFGPNARRLFTTTVRFDPEGRLVEQRLGP
ncbi:MAG: metal-dependent hydrolase [Acidobacteria bacterium]|nr:metal-dependent hydrolase [Acidobacteriota bacterium]